MKKTRRAVIVTTVTGTQDEILAELAEVRVGWRQLGKVELSEQAGRARVAVQKGAQGVTVGHIKYVVGPDCPDLENVLQTCARIAAAGQDDPLSDIADVLRAADDEHERQDAREVPEADHVVTRAELATYERMRRAMAADEEDYEDRPAEGPVEDPEECTAVQLAPGLVWVGAPGKMVEELAEMIEEHQAVEEPPIPGLPGWKEAMGDRGCER